METICEDIGFISGWIGIIWCLCSLILLSLKANELITKIKKNEDDYKENKQFKHDTIFLLIYSFGCAICTLVYCIFYATIGTKPNELHIIMTQQICQYTAQYMANAGWQLSRYCFYNFMLWRIRASFREPEELKLSNYTFGIYLVLIHIWLIFVLTVTVFFTPRQLTPQGDCSVRENNIFAGFTTTDIRTVIWSFDFALTTGLLLLFIRRLKTLTTQNDRINAYRKKTIILGILATSTSIAIVLCTYFMVNKEWRFFIPLDLLINLSCVVFTFKFSRDMCPYCNIKCYQNNVYHEHENIQPESMFEQNNDRDIWSILNGSRSDAQNTMHSDTKNSFGQNGIETDNQPLKGEINV